ncbi:Pre-mRNA-splicing factor CWC25 [Pleurostoma richardsiae]|uniref:Pre-mRNA-splicing factor CWC25 n=1 Tax=Pleurostoma richardsiae TaxID=41990 RepID=A0AA38VWE3_9PEZI|nr:Pre-mRNA-splicing factor CWC25 [Pleurostoma richardsiae]
MGGDLNLKKSWHPTLMRNQIRVHDAEVAAIAERKKTEARLEEIRKERQQEEIARKLEASGQVVNKKRGLEWMYQGGPSGEQGIDEYGSEAFLLGKRRIDTLLKDNEAKKLERQAAQDSILPTQNVNAARDTAAKIRQDPLLAIKAQEQAAYEALLNDPLKRRQLLASMGISDDKERSKSKRKEDRHHRHRHRHRHHDDDSDYERRHKRRRSSSRDRSGSQGRYESDDEDRRSKRRRSLEGRRRYDSEDERDYSERRSRRSDRGDRDSGRRDRSQSPRRDVSDEDKKDRWDRDDDRRRKRYDSPERREDSPPGRRRDDARDTRDRRERPRDSYRGNERNGSNGNPERRYNDRRNDRPRYNGGPRESSSSKSEEEERARKLAAMQDAASDLDRVRETRLAEMAERERAEREADNRAREKSSKYGDDRAFVNSLHRTAGSESLADRLGRGRRGFQRDED